LLAESKASKIREEASSLDCSRETVDISTSTPRQTIRIH
jgi:hypothetical protein